MNDLWGMLSSGGADATRVGLLCAVKATGVLLGAGLLAFGWQRRAAATRHLIWTLGLAGALLVLPLSLALPRWGLPILAAPEMPVASQTPPAPAPKANPASVARPLVRVEPPAPAHQPASVAAAVRVEPVASWDRLRRDPALGLLAIWAAGTAAVLAWCSVGWITIGRLGRTARPITDECWTEAARVAAERLGMRGTVALLRGGPSVMPVTWGILRPVILLPAEADEWPLDRRRAVLMHELAHVRRRDGLTQGIAVLACAVYWFNPLAWWGAARLRAEREQACDDLVLEAGERPSHYAAELLGVARSLRSPARLAAAAMAMARPSGLENRLLAILDARRNRRKPARWLVVAALVVVLGASAPLAAVRLVPRQGAQGLLTGLVVGPDGKAPVEGADVVVLRSPKMTAGHRAYDPTPAEILGRGRSDAQGEFHLNLGARDATPADDLLFVVTARGSCYAARKLSDLKGPVGPPIALRPDQPIAVQLVDLEGSPLAGASVRLQTAYPKFDEGLRLGTLTQEALPSLAAVQTTDATGRFVLRGVGPEESLVLWVQAPGFGEQWLQLRTEITARPVVLTLGRAHLVEGRVTLGPGGPPASGAKVHIQSMSGSDGMGMTQSSTDTSTDTDGRYRVEAAPGDSIRIEVYPPSEGADGYLLRGRVVTPGIAITSHEDFALPLGVLVRGRVVDAASGQGIAGAVISHHTYQRNNPFYIEGNPNYLNRDEQQATTAADGTFRLGVMPGPGYLLAKGPTSDYLHDEVSMVDLYGELIWPNWKNYPDSFRKLDLNPAAGPVEVNLTLRRGVTVQGHLAAPDNQSDQAPVLFSRWSLPPFRSTINGYDPIQPLRGGRFELRGCDPGSSASVFFLDVERQRGAVIDLSGKQAGQDLEVKLAPCGSATLRFVNAQGKPIRPGRPPGLLEVVLSPGGSFGDTQPGEQISPLMADVLYCANIDRKRYNDLKIDGDGRVTFPTLIPGATYRLTIHNQPVRTHVEFTVQPGEAKNLGDLIISNLDRAG